MISSKDIFALQRLNYSLGIFLLLGILLKNSALEAFRVGAWLLRVKVFHKIFSADFKISLRLLEYFDLLLSVYSSDIV